jgi:hypothetical protein
MPAAVSLQIYPALAVALIDNTSFGTLLFPIRLMLSPGRLRARRIVLYFAVIGAFYFVLGVAAIGLITTSNLSLAESIAVFGYCLVMVAPGPDQCS